MEVHPIFCSISKSARKLKKKIKNGQNGGRFSENIQTQFSHFVEVGTNIVYTRYYLVPRLGEEKIEFLF